MYIFVSIFLRKLECVIELTTFSPECVSNPLIRGGIYFSYLISILLHRFISARESILTTFI